MLRKTTTLAIAGVLTATAAAQAQEQDFTADGYGPEQSDWELILGASGSNDKDFESGSFNLNAEVGYYVTDTVAAGLRQSIGYAESGDDSVSTLSSALFADYHFDMGAFRPFVGGSVGYAYGNAVEETFFAGPEAGVKWYVKDDTFIYGRATYQFLFEDTDDADDAFDDGRFNYVVGIGFNF